MEKKVQELGNIGEGKRLELLAKDALVKLLSTKRVSVLKGMSEELHVVFNHDKLITDKQDLVMLFRITQELARHSLNFVSSFRAWKKKYSNLLILEGVKKG